MGVRETDVDELARVTGFVVLTLAGSLLFLLGFGALLECLRGRWR